MWLSAANLDYCKVSFQITLNWCGCLQRTWITAKCPSKLHSIDVAVCSELGLLQSVLPDYAKLMWLSAANLDYCKVSFQTTLNWCGCLQRKCITAKCPSKLHSIDVAVCSELGLLQSVLPNYTQLMWLSAANLDYCKVSFQITLNWCGCLQRKCITAKCPSNYTQLMWLSAANLDYCKVSFQITLNWCGCLQRTWITAKCPSRLR